MSLIASNHVLYVRQEHGYVQEFLVMLLRAQTPKPNPRSYLAWA
jgi:hypothetical protein